MQLEPSAGLSTFIRVQNGDGVSFEIEIGFGKCPHALELVANIISAGDLLIYRIGATART
jgi:hypothetical protein